MAMSFCGAISKLFKDAGLKDILIEAEIVAVGSINGVMSGKHYNRSVRSHKVVYEALMTLLFEQYLDSLSEDKRDETITMIENLATKFPGEEYVAEVMSTEFEELKTSVFTFAQREAERKPTFALWLSYIEMVQTLLSFLRATRENNWDLHLSAVKSMLPWFFAKDRIHYARYGMVYWLEMLCLETSHPGATDSIINNWTCQRQKTYGFSSTACDQVMEQTYNRDSKVRGGIVGFTLNKNAVHRWVMAQADRGAITRQCFTMTDSSTNSRLLAVGKARNVDMKEVLTYSLRKFPSPIATVDGELVKTPKAKLLHILEGRVEDPLIEDLPFNNALIPDGMALIQAIKRVPETFGALVESILGRLILSSAVSSKSTRVDFVCDTYPDVSIKNLERSKRADAGSTGIMILGPQQKVPRQFKKFLSVGKNKEALVEFFFHHLKNVPILSNALTNVELYICHGHRPAIPAAMYFDTGVGNQRRILDVCKLHLALGSDLCDSLIGFHAFTGCDSTSAFYGKGKTKTLNTLEKYPKFFATFKLLGSACAVTQELFCYVQKYVCFLYGQLSHDDVNDARFNIFSIGQYSENTMPCTKDALWLHTCRSSYQAYIWKNALQATLPLPPINECGWDIKNGQVLIKWMTMPAAPDGILKNVNCGCQSGCSTRRCACLKAQLMCTNLCACRDCLNIYVDENGIEDDENENEFEQLVFDDDDDDVLADHMFEE